MASLTALLVAALVLIGPRGSGPGRAGGGTPGPRGAPATATAVTVTWRAVRTIPAGFVGLSMELDGLTTAGGPIGPFDPVLAQLIRNLSPGARPVLRIGGDSTDWSWWPIRGVRPPPGLRYSLTPAWLREVRDLAQATDARLIVGINLQSGSRRVAGTEAREVVDGIGRRWILGLEPGNEPELYRTLPALTRSGTADNTGQRFAAFARTYSRVTGGLPAVALAGPSVGSDKWLPYLSRFLRAEPRVRLVTVHRYPLKHCGSGARNSVDGLLTGPASDGLARSLRASVKAAHTSGRALRVDEINSVSCGGEAGVSDTFASALWALNTLFAMARVGVDGVNVHTRPYSLSQLFSLSRSGSVWRAVVRPVYYGLLTFALAAPAGSRLLRVSQPGTRGLHVWATRTPAGVVHVVLINETLRRRTVDVRLPVPATMSRTVLQASSLGASGGVTFGGQSFSPVTTTGVLAGAQRVGTAGRVKGALRVPVPPASAVMLSGRA
jgi:hypothetical protein